jgi:hypothetical protein
MSPNQQISGIVQQMVAEALKQSPTTASYTAVVSDHEAASYGVDIIHPEGHRSARLEWALHLNKNWKLYVFEGGYREGVIGTAMHIDVDRFGDVIRANLIGVKTRHALQAARKATGMRLRDLGSLFPFGGRRLAEFERGLAVPTGAEWDMLRDVLDGLPEQWVE